MLDIKPKNKNKAINISISLNQTIKDLENLDCQWALKWFGIYKLQAWFDKKVKKVRDHGIGE